MKTLAPIWSAAQKHAQAITHRLFLVLALTAASAFAPGAAQGQAPTPAPLASPPPLNVISLSDSATLEVPMDWLTVVYSSVREGTDANQVQSQLRQDLDSALSQARNVAKPGQLQVRTGGFSLHPRHSPQGRISGWQGQAELVVEGRDTQAIAQLMGRLQTLNIARVGWSLSREAREGVEAEVTAQAIARFRSRAEAVTRHFGLSGYRLREISVSSSDPAAPPQQPMLRTQALRAMSADEALPVQAGTAQVSVSVSGSVQMN